ncbi:MAG: PAS domain S-box protein, partial [Ignavibacterium sp.]|nr:PAS domain S-box protein [Ignavibacterium sp.]
MIVIELIYNLSVLVALSVLSGFLSTRFSKTALTGKILQGLLFGVTAIIGMLYPFNFAEGIIFDGRSIVISLCALFFGPLSGSIAAIMAAGYRMSIGGGGAIMGVLVILSSFLIGYFFYNYRSKKTGNKIQVWEFYVLGIIVHIFMLLFILTLPSKNIAETYKTIALTIIGIYPLVTVLIGRILLDQEQNLDFINTLKESEKLFRTTLYSIGDGVITTDSDGKIVNMNNIASEITGWKETEVKEKYLSEVFKIINEDTMLPVENPVETVLREGYIVGLANHTLLIRKDGKQVPISDSGSPIKNDDNKIIGVVLVFRDQTEERAQEKMMIESEERFRLLYENAPLSYQSLDINGNLIDVNQTWLQSLGYERDEVIGHHFSEFMTAQSGELIKSRFPYFLKLGEIHNFEFEMIRKDGTHMFVSYEGKIGHDKLGNFKQTHCIFSDITDRKSYEDSLRANEEKYRMLLDFATDAFFQCDQSTFLITVNNKATELTGYTKEELLKMNLKELFPQKVLEASPLQFDLLRSGKTVKKERTIIRKNGNLVDVEMMSKQMPDGTIQSFFRDITELKESEERFTSIVRGLSDMIIIVDGNGKIFYQSPSVTKTLGYTETEMFGRSPLEFVVEEDKINVEIEFKEVMTASNSGIPTLYNVYCKDGSKCSIETAGVNMLGNPAVKGVVLFSRDVTARLKASLLEKENAKLFEDLIIKNTEPILILSFEGKILFANPACYKLAEIEESVNITGLLLSVFMSEQESLKAFEDLKELEKSSGPLSRDYEIKTFKNSLKWISAFSTKINFKGSDASLVTLRDITDRIKFEETLKISEENYKYLFENNPQPMWVYDIDTLEYLAVNEYAVNKYGYTKEEFLSMSLLDIRPKDEHERLKKDVHKNDEAIQKSGYWKHRTKDGKILFVEIYSHRLNFMGRNARLVMANDVTERKIFEDALKKSEETYRLTAEQTGEVVYDHNMITKETKWAGAIEKVTGYTYDEFINTVADDIYKQVDPEDKDRVLSICKSAINNGSNYRVEYRFKHKNGNYIYVEDNAAFITDSDNKPVRMLGTLTDITKRKLIENKLRDLSRAVEQSPVSIVVTDIKGNIEYVNPKFEEVSGYSFDEVIGKNPKILASGIKSTDDYQEMWLTILNGEEWRGEFFNKKKNGELYWEAATISPILNEKNEIEKFIAVKEDVTGQKKLTKELIEAKEKAEEMVRLKSYFFANMSHELRTPFVGILGFAEILKDVLENREEREYAEQILKSSKRLTDTLNKILNLSRIEFDKVEVKNTRVDVCELLKSIESFYSNSAKINNTTITSSVEEDNLTIYSDAKLLEDILNNLVSNAIKFTEDGSINLSAKRIIDKDNTRLLITVKDTGIGIPKEKQSLVWQEFRQASEGYNRSFEGTGLGLTITKRYVELLNGTI